MKVTTQYFIRDKITGKYVRWHACGYVEVELLDGLSYANKCSREEDIKETLRGLVAPRKKNNRAREYIDRGDDVLVKRDRDDYEIVRRVTKVTEKVTTTVVKS